MNLSTVKWAQWDKTQSRELLVCSYVCAMHCAQLLHTILHRTDLIIFPLTLQTITTAPMMSIWGKGGETLKNAQDKCLGCLLRVDNVACGVRSWHCARRSRQSAVHVGCRRVADVDRGGQVLQTRRRHQRVPQVCDDDELSRHSCHSSTQGLILHVCHRHYGSVDVR